MAMTASLPAWPDWPGRDSSRIVEAGGVSWHVQQSGHGPDLLLVHGTGASTHSWRGLMPYLTERWRVTAPDLPGHGFTDPIRHGQPTLPAIAHVLTALVEQLAIRPMVAVGHSAGAAILARMAIDGGIRPALLVAINGAFLPFRGIAVRMFPQLARLLVANPLVARTLALSSSERTVNRMIRGSGSSIDEHGIDLYGRLFRDHHHVAGALEMMANWDLAPLVRDLPRLDIPTLLIVGEGDRYVDPSESRIVARLIPQCERVLLPGLGHLMHEEAPAKIADLILDRAEAAGADAAP
jgi:magnesium chelatase accessory protein